MAEQQQPKHVFISYASENVGVADSICATLEREGLKCWIAPRDVMPGERFAEAIVRAISAASSMVLVLSEHAIASPHVAREIERACAKRRPLIAFRIDSEPLTPEFEYFLSNSHWLDARASVVTPALTTLVTAARRYDALAAQAEITVQSPRLKLTEPAVRSSASGEDASPDRASLLLLLLLLGTGRTSKSNT